MARLPPDFVSVDTTKCKTYQALNVMGLVVDALPPRQTGGSSTSSTFTIKDCDFSSESWRGLKIRFFRDNKADLPCPNVGDVVLLRMIQISDYRGVVMGLSPQADASAPRLAWSIFRSDARTSGGCSITNSKGPPSAEEKSYAQSLLNQGSRPTSLPGSATAPVPVIDVTPRAVQKNSFPTPTSAKSPAGAPRRFSLLKDLEYSRFSDIVGQVVKTFPAGHDRFTLYVTDYTHHKDLFNYTQEDDGAGRDGDPFGYAPRRQKREWPGPFGRMTIQITLYNPHAGFAQANVSEGNFVLLQNVHIKEDRMHGRMEGVIHTDRGYKEKLYVRVIEDSEPNELVKEVLRRKKEYWKRTKSDMRWSEGSAKRQLSDNEGNMSKRAKKKRQMERKKKIQKDDLEQPKLTTTLVKRDELNSYVRASNPAISCRSVAKILDSESHKNSAPGGIEYMLPFQNLRYRASVRIVDFFPPKLEDFAVKYDVDRAMMSDGGSTDGDSDSDGNTAHRRTRWEWRFCLLVEDGGPGTHYNRDEPRARMKLFVADQDAVFLLKMDAEDLRKNPQTLLDLREKLFFLWGNLEECKNANPDFHPDDPASKVSTRPFVCCIKEYGVRVLPESSNSDDDDDEEERKERQEKYQSESPLVWERRFRMFETTLID